MLLVLKSSEEKCPPVSESLANAQIEVKKSRFIAEIFYVQNAAKVREFLKEQKNKYKDARHVVHAFVLADGNVMGCSDDGEPGGTAGKPVLDVLKGSGVVNAMISVTRYFGGVLLGTGGLVKAYSDAAKAVIDKVVSENLLEEKIERKAFEFSSGYELYEALKKICLKFEAVNLVEDFSESITIKGEIPLSNQTLFSKAVEELSLGKIVPTFVC